MSAAKPIVIRDQTVGDALDAAAAKWGDAIGWIFEDELVSFASMRAETDRVARALLAADIGPGDIVAIWTPNLREFPLVEFACAKIGAITAAINTRFRAFEVAHMLGQSEAKLLIMVETFLKHDYRKVLAELGIHPRAGKVAATDHPSLRRVVSLAPTPDAAFEPWRSFVAAGDAVDAARLREIQAARQWREPMLLQYTSGTTAAPKGALLNHRYVLNVGNALFTNMGVKPGEAIMNTQPFYHIGGSCGALPTPLTIGCRMVIPQYYEAERILQLIARERCVARTGFPAMYIAEMNHPRFRQFDISSLRTGWCGGTPEFLKQVSEVMDIPGLMLTYSSTEVGGTGSRFDDPWEQRLTSAGPVLTGTEMQIRDVATAKPVGSGVKGEVLMRGWWQMNGYLKDPVQTAKVIDAEGWVHTGDLGYVDERQCLHFAGRIKDMLKVGGENVAAEEVEGVLITHPKIKLAAVIGAADPRLDEVPMAIIELHDGQKLTAEEVIAFCASRMANFRVPRYVRFVTEWPMTGSGKIMKHKLREIFAVANTV